MESLVRQDHLGQEETQEKTAYQVHKDLLGLQGHQVNVVLLAPQDLLVFKDCLERLEILALPVKTENLAFKGLLVFPELPGIVVNEDFPVNADQ